MGPLPLYSMGAEKFSKRSQCEGKAAFTSVALARKRARALSDRVGITHMPYGCPHCGRMHIGERVLGKQVRNFKFRKRRLAKEEIA